MSDPALLTPNDQNLQDEGYELLTNLPDEENAIKYTYCCHNIHVVLLTKIISLLTIPFYLTVTLFIWRYGNELAFLFTAIIIGSVIVFTLHGAFKGSKMCLIPYIFLQSLFVIYDVVLIGICLYGSFYRNSFLTSLVEAEIQLVFGYNPNASLLILALLLTLCLLPLVWTIHVVYLDFLFIAEVDEMLEYIREVNENCSKDDTSPTGTGTKINNF